MQTASITASILGVTDMRINYSLAKWMRDKFAEKKSDLINPFDSLLIGRSQKTAELNRKYKNKFIKKYLHGVSYHDEIFYNPEK